ncbi:flavin-containing monooxygenase [Nocardia sp. NPDC055029]
MSDSRTRLNPEPSQFDVVVVGAGFAGLYQLHRLRAQGFRVRVVEAGDGVGGTWYWNRYPGARCDVPSVDYSYSFSAELQQEWEWSEKYAAQPEILRYLEHVADRFDLRRDIEFGTKVAAATFDEDSATWLVETTSGLKLRTRYLVMATGALSDPRLPDIPGIEDFAGEALHTARWPRDGADLRGKRVGVIGTGSSGVQVTPILAAQAAHLTVFQRTPAFCLPANNRPLTDEERRHAKERAPWRRKAARESSFGMVLPKPTQRALEVDAEERETTYEAHWREGAVMPLMLSYRDLMTNHEANETVAEFARRKIADAVDDPQLAQTLTPRGFPFGAKRACVGTNYPAVFNLPHVQLADVLNDPIERITPAGVRTASGAEYAIDVMVFATGFDAMTGALNAIDIRGRAGQQLAEKWSVGPHNYLGLMTHGFPNMFIIGGPGSPSALSNMVISIELQVDWIADCLAYLRDDDLNMIDAAEAAEQSWVDEVNRLASATLYPEGNSWYLGANVPGKPRVFMPYTRGVGTYAQVCDDVVADGYRGFVLDSVETETNKGDRDLAELPERPAS